MDPKKVSQLNFIEIVTMHFPSSHLKAFTSQDSGMNNPLQELSVYQDIQTDRPERQRKLESIQ